MSAASAAIAPEAPAGIAEQLSKLLIGQDAAIRSIIPYIQTYQAGLSPSGRPIGVFLLLGPTGTGKTKTVEALAQVLHGSSKYVLRIDCGEFQHDHEIAKLIGPPPGYLGYGENKALLSQAYVNPPSSSANNISLILFDEIEKAAPSMTRLLLGILDKATLNLGSNATVNFDKCLIFLTSNIGSTEISRWNNPSFGLESMLPVDRVDNHKSQSIGMAAVKKRFSPEFVNRIDSVLTYIPLSREVCSLILDRAIEEFAELVQYRLGARAFKPRCTTAARNKLLDEGTSIEFGARELKRTLQRHFTQPIAAMLSSAGINPSVFVTLDVVDGEYKIEIY